MGLIECRYCNELDCTGCNIDRLAFALRRGLLDGLKDEHNAVCITSAIAPATHGWWSKHIFDGIMGGRPWTYMCSYCNFTFPVKTNYCPNCGAKMDGGDHDAAD